MKIPRTVTVSLSAIATAATAYAWGLRLVQRVDRAVADTTFVEAQRNDSLTNARQDSVIAFNQRTMLEDRRETRRMLCYIAHNPAALCASLDTIPHAR